MPDLYVCGASAINYYSKCGICVTTDLLSFSNTAVPDLPYTHMLGAARSPDSTCLITTNSGGVIRTSDFVSYVCYDMNFKQSQMNQIIHNNQFIAAGYDRNHLNQEQAQLWISGNGFDQYSWQARYAVFDTYSAFTNLCTTAGSNVVAVGYADNLRTSLLVMGTALGTWQRVNLPSQLQGGLWSVASDGVRVWVGGQGWVATALLSNLNSWTKTDLGVSQTVRSLVTVNNQVVAVAGDQIFYSDNLFDYQHTQVPGHTLTQCVVFGDKVIIGSHSLLTQSDLFVWDPTLKSLQNKSCGVQAYAFMIV